MGLLSLHLDYPDETLSTLACDSKFVVLRKCSDGKPRSEPTNQETEISSGHTLRGLSLSESRAILQIGYIREKQTCTELRSTISRHLLHPISRWEKTVDSYRRSCRNCRTSHRKGGAGFRYRKRPVPPWEEGGEGDTTW